MSPRERAVRGALAGAFALAAGGAAYGLHRLGSAYRPGAPLAGLEEFARTVRERAATRERDLRDALGLDLAAPQGEQEGEGAGEALTAGQARELLRDPAGPTPR